MTSFQDLIDSTIILTKRPDLVSETTLALKKAIIKEHSAIDYPRDLATVTHELVQPDPNNYRYSITLEDLEVSATLSKIKHVSEVIQQTDVQHSFSGYWGSLIFTEIAPDDLFNNYNREKAAYYYRAGNTINIVAPRLVENIGIQYYAFPDLSDTDVYSDWLADLYDYVLYTHAAAEVFRLIGKTDEYRAQLAAVLDNRFDVIKREIGEIG